MRNKKKVVMLILLVTFIIAILTSCDSLDGIYIQTSGNGNSSLTFDGSHLIINDLGVFEVPGTYTINGDKLIFDCVINGEATTYTYSWSRSANTITLDGDIFTKASNTSGAVQTVFCVFLIVILLTGLGGIIMMVYRRVKRSVHSEIIQKNDSAPISDRELTDNDEEWEEISPPTKKNYTPQHQTTPKEAVSIVKIDADHCCICGRELDDGSTRLNGLQSGREAWLDSGCLKKLLTMTQGNDLAEFEEAARYMKSRVSVVDPDVGISLRKFISKSEDRIHRKY